MKIQTLVSLLFFAGLLSAQPQFQSWTGPTATSIYHTHGVVTAFSDTLISEDFGPRQLNTLEYQWHGGIDYNSANGNADYGDLISAVHGGNISEYSQMRTGTKSLIVEGVGVNSMRYVHVFTAGTLTLTNQIETGACILKTMDAPNNIIPTTVSGTTPHETWAIIIRDSGAYTAYGPEPPTPPGMVTFTDEAGVSQTIAVNSIVAAGDPLVSLGNSDGYPAHLHLEILTQLTTQGGGLIPAGNDNWVKDPLQDFANHSVPTYNVDFFLQDDVTQGIEIVYPGTGEETIQIHVEMNGQAGNAPVNRYNVIMNVDDLDVLARKQGGNFDNLRGPNKISKFSHGARVGNARLNMPLAVTNANCGSWNRTHMQPFAYAGANAPNGHHPRDDYHFADFVTRIKNSHAMGSSSTFADYPMDARYNDGKYEIKARVINVLGDTTESAIHDFTLDNFKPFIQEVEIIYDVTTIYNSSWSGTDPIPGTAGDGFISQSPIIRAGANLTGPLVPGGIVFRTIASEPLEDLYMDIKDVDTAVTYVNYELGVTVDPDRQIWEFYVPYETLPINSCFQMILYGTDCSGNDILELNAGANNFIPARQNTLNDATTWSAGPPSGHDEVHEFCINQCGLGKEGAISFEKSGMSDCVLDPTTINQYATPATDSETSDGTVTITFPDFDETYAIEWRAMNEEVVISNAIQATGLRPGIYCWTVYDPGCCREYSNCLKVVDCSRRLTPITLYADANCRRNYIDLQVAGGVPPFTYNWTNPFFINLPTTQDLVAPRPGTYCVEVRDACGQTANICQEVGWRPMIFGVQTYDICLGPDGYGSIELFGGFTPPAGYEFLWSDGSTEPSLLNLDLPGEYCVWITNESDCEAKECYVIGYGSNGNELETAITPTCYGANEGTIALLNVSHGLEIVWDNGATGPELTGLDAGEYCVTISSDLCGDISECFTVNYECCSEIELNLIAYPPSSCNANDGSISIFQGGSITGAVNPITYQWNTGHTGNTLGNLGPGLYSLTVTDAIGCTGSEYWDLTIDNFVTSSASQPACEGESNGVGIVIASNSGTTANQQGDFKFVWSDGLVKEGGTFSAREDLPTGTYTITVTDIESTPPCDIIVAIEVGETPTNGQFLVETFAEATCANSPTGAITVQPNGGNEPYSFYWSTGSYSQNISGLNTGYYQVTVKDVCGRESIKGNEIWTYAEPHVDLIDYGGCDGQGWADVEIVHEYEYEITWKYAQLNDNGQLIYITSKYFPEYTIVDENGCEHIGYVPIYLGSSFTDVAVTHTCDGLAEGVISGWVGIQNLEEPLTVKINQVEHVFSPDSNPFYFAIGGLENGHKTVRITNDGCQKTYDLIVENLTEQGELIALHYEENVNEYFCEYERNCEGEGLPSLIVSATVDYYDNNQRCKFPVFCGDMDMDEKVKFNKQKLKAWPYLQLLLAIENNPAIINYRLPSGLISQRISEYYMSGAEDCDWIRYCPVNFEIIRVIDNPSSTSLGSGMQNNCPIISCQYASIFGISVDFVHDAYCFDNEDVAQYLGLTTTIELDNFNTNFLDVECFLQTNKLIEVWYAYLAGNLDYLGNIQATEIYTDIIQKYMVDFQSGERFLNCSRVRWCSNDGSVDHIDIVLEEDCLTIVPWDQDLLTCDLFEGAAYCTYNNGYIAAYVLTDEIGPQSPAGAVVKSGEIKDHEIFNLTAKDDYLNLSPIVMELELEDTTIQYIDYDYIRDTYYGFEFVDFYRNKRPNEPAYLQDKVYSIYSNELLQQDVYIHELSDYERAISFGGKDEEYVLDIAFQSSFEILSVDQYVDSVVFQVFHHDDINVDGINIEGVAGGNLSQLIFKFSTGSIESKTFEGVKRKSVFISKHGNSESQACYFWNGDNLSINGQEVDSHLVAGVYNIRFDLINEQPIETYFEPLIYLSSNITSIESLDFLFQKRLALVLGGDGVLTIPQVDQSIFLSDDLSLVSVDLQTFEVVKKGFSVSNLSSISSIKVSLNNYSGIGLAISLTETLLIDGSTYQPLGDQDLVFLRFDNFGNLIQQKIWGRPGAKITIQDFKLTPFSAFFGGEVDDESSGIIIGNQRFVYHDNHEHHSFLASQVLENGGEFKSQARSIENGALEILEEFTVFPNPTSGLLHINSKHSDNPLPAKFKLFSAQGQLLDQGELGVAKNHEMSISHLPAGVYVLTLLSGEYSQNLKLIKQ